MLAVGQGGPRGDLEDLVLGSSLNDFLMRYCVNLRTVRTGQVLQKVSAGNTAREGN